MYERRFELAVHELRARCHEQQRLGAIADGRLGVEQQLANSVAEDRPARLAVFLARDARALELRQKAVELRAQIKLGDTPLTETWIYRWTP